MSIINVLRMFFLVSMVGLLAGCGLTPVSLNPTISTSGVDTGELEGRTVYLKVRDGRSEGGLGSVVGEQETIMLDARRSPSEVLRDSIARTLEKYGMTIVSSVGDSDNQMFVSIKDLEYLYPVPSGSERAETSATIRISLAGDRTAHENIVSTWARYDTGYPRGRAVAKALNDVLGRAASNALREKKMISVLAGK